MTMPDFVATSGELTPDGRRLIDWIEAQFREADATNDLSRLNGLSGYLAYYYVNVHKVRSLTPAQWLTEHKHSGAAAAWRDMQYMEEAARQQAKQQAAVEAVTGQAGELAGRIDALQHTLDEALAKIAALEAKPEAQAEAKPARKGKKAVKEAETEGEAGKAADEESPADENKPDEDEDKPDEDEDGEAGASKKEA